MSYPAGPNYALRIALILLAVLAVSLPVAYVSGEHAGQAQHCPAVTK